MTQAENRLETFNIIKHFTSRDALGIKALTVPIIGLLVGHGLLKKPADLFSLKQEKSVLLTILPEKVVENLLSSIEDSRKTTLERFLFALNIPMIGYMSSKRIARRFGSIEKVMNASVDEVKAVNHIGQTAATTMHNFFAQPHHREHIKQLLDAGIELSPY